MVSFRNHCETNVASIMKKWPFIVAGLYGLVLLALLGPLIMFAFMPETFTEPPNLYGSEFITRGWVWGPIVVMILAQFALLRVPVAIASRRPVTQRPLLMTILGAALMMGLLVFGAALSLYEMAFKDKGDDRVWMVVALGIVSWIFWAIYFYVTTKGASPDAQVAGIRRSLWKGSILELLVAIPTHIVARHRDYCCAGFLTFIGLCCGFSVMLFAFGPAVYFLFVERWRRLHANHDQENKTE